MANFTVEPISWQDNMNTLRNIRSDVFVKEQRVPPEEEWDGRDENALHVLAVTLEGKPVGTARLLDSGQIGRMAVLREYRKQGIGGAMLRRLLELAEEHKISNLFLNAQISAVGFYKRFGFVEEGDTFMEAGIIHRKMIISPPLDSPVK